MPRRHDLLRLRPQGWPDVLAASAVFDALTGETRALVAGWAERGWPVIARRREIDDPEDHLAVGLPLPPFLGKLRLGFAVPRDLVMETLAPIALSEAAATAPAAWREQIVGALALGGPRTLQPAVFGALLWQHLTRLAYLRPGSDLDLIWPTPAAQALPGLLDGLDALDAAGPARIDGEVVLADGGGVNWRELHREFRRPGGAVLVKSMEGADLRCTHALFA